MKKYGLTYPQKNIWLVEKFNGGSSINSIVGSIEIKNRFDEVACKSAINFVIQNNDAMRIILDIQNVDVKQYVSQYEYIDIKVVDMSFISQEKIEEYKNDFALQPILLEKNRRLYEFEILKYASGKGEIIMKIHHMICDAWSCGKIGTQIIEFIENRKEVECQNRPSYIEFVEKEKEYELSEKYKKDEEFWKNYLLNVKEPVSLKDKNHISTVASRYTAIVDSILNEKINKYCKDNKISPYALFLSALSTYIYRIKDEKDFVIGTPVLNRATFKEKNMLGMFISTVPFRANITEGMSFIELTKKISVDTLTLFRHQKYPYTKMLKNLRMQSSMKKNLYNIVLSYQNARTDLLDKEKYSTTWTFVKRLNDELQIHITDMDNTGKLIINYDYLVEIFSNIEIKYLHTRLMTIIENAINDINVDIESIKIISDDEKKDLIYGINNTSKDYQKDMSVIELFERQTKNNPRNIALISNNKKLSYEELNKRANKLANYLILEKNIEPNDVVALIMKRDESLIVSLLAILKCKATYVPIDYKFPEGRILNMLEGVRLVLTNSSLNFDFEKKIDTVNVENVEDKLANLNDENVTVFNNLSSDKKIDYIIYTSGSTGKPKGVMITSKNLVNFVLGINKYINIDFNLRFVSITTISFDIFGLEIWSTLSNGATMILANDIECINQNELNKLCLEHGANIIQTTPTKLNMLLTQTKEIDFIKNMKEILLGGEGIPVNFVEGLRQMTNATIFNLYGPSETTIWSTVKNITTGDITAGKPIQNTGIYIVDSKNRLLPKFCNGELCISGDSVSRGYFNREDLTNKVFINLPFIKERVYKTGDLACINEKDEVCILGRIDFQVKINGQRVELEEIEKHILRDKNIKNAVVVLNKDKKLVCFYTLNEKQNFNEEVLNKSLLAKLPTYMVPNIYVKLEEFPNTLNNKIDRKFLINMDVKIKDKIRKIEKPKTQTEIIIYNVWKKVLDDKDFGIDDNFFELDTDSLDAIKVQIELVSKNIHIEYSDLTRCKTIRNLAKKIDEKNRQIEYKVENFDKDYSMILNKNNSVFKSQKYDVKNVILSGVTGFLGSHILAEIINMTDSKVFCFIRGKNGKNASERLKNTLHYFFDKKYDKYIGERIIPIDADITSLNNFNITDSNLELLKNSNINFFVHSAACVKHYGKITNFSDINIGGTQAVAKYCFENDINLIHISTLSISGNAFETSYTRNNKKEIIFDESSFYKQQNLNNVYVYTKFRAEEVVLDYMKKGLKANILRIGNLTSRYYNPKFQPNVEENAFAGRIKTFIDLGYMPKLENLHVEFSPIDLTARAIVKIIKYFNTENTIFHLFNHNHVTIKRLVNILEELGINIKMIPSEEFSKYVKEISNSDKRYLLKGIINDLDENGLLDYSTSVKIKSKITRKYMESIGYEWKRITDKYIIDYLKCLRDSGFIQF